MLDVRNRKSSLGFARQVKKKKIPSQTSYTVELHLFREAHPVYICRERGEEAGYEDWRDRGGGGREKGSKAGKNGEKGRERGTPCPTSNKLVIIFSQYLSWIGCYFIIFYCLLLLLLPVRKPPSVPARSPATHSLPPPLPSFLSPPSTAADVPLCFIISSLSSAPHRGNSLAELIIEGFILL